MARKDESKKDQIILQQMEVIRSMTEHNLQRMGTDFWGTPVPERKPETSEASRKETPEEQKSRRNRKKSPRRRRRRRRRSWRTCWRSWTGILVSRRSSGRCAALRIW